MELIERSALVDANMTTLVEIYNGLSPKTPAGPKTFSTRAKAIDRIMVRQAELLNTPEAHEAVEDVVSVPVDDGHKHLGNPPMALALEKLRDAGIASETQAEA